MKRILFFYISFFWVSILVAQNPLLTIKEVEYHSHKHHLSNYSTEEESFLYQTTSEDSSKHASVIVMTDHGNKFKEMRMMVLDGNGDTMWCTVEKSILKDHHFHLSDIAVSNEGKLYLGIKIFTSYYQKSVGESLCLITCHDKECKTYLYSFPVGSISNMRMKLLNNSNLFFCGYFDDGSKRNSTPNSFFSIVFNPFNEEFGILSHQHLEEIVTDGNAIHFFSNQIKNSQFSLICKEVIELENGEIVLLGEQVATILNNENERENTIFCYHNKDIIYHYFYSDGTIKSFHSIPKYQIASTLLKISSLSHIGLSYCYFQNGNDIFILYNDNVGNYSPKKKRMLDFNLNRSIKRSCTVFTKLSQEGENEKKIINIYQENPIILTDISYSGGREVLLSFKGKKSFSHYLLTY